MASNRRASQGFGKPKTTTSRPSQNKSFNAANNETASERQNRRNNDRGARSQSRAFASARRGQLRRRS